MSVLPTSDPSCSTTGRADQDMIQNSSRTREIDEAGAPYTLCARGQSSIQEVEHDASAFLILVDEDPSDFGTIELKSKLKF